MGAVCLGPPGWFKGARADGWWHPVATCIAAGGGAGTGELGGGRGGGRASVGSDGGARRAALQGGRPGSDAAGERSPAQRAGSGAGTDAPQEASHPRQLFSLTCSTYDWVEPLKQNPTQGKLATLQKEHSELQQEHDDLLVLLAEQHTKIQHQKKQYVARYPTTPPFELIIWIGRICRCRPGFATSVPRSPTMRTTTTMIRNEPRAVPLFVQQKVVLEHIRRTLAMVIQ